MPRPEQKRLVSSHCVSRDTTESTKMSQESEEPLESKNFGTFQNLVEALVAEHERLMFCHELEKRELQKRLVPGHPLEAVQAVQVATLEDVRDDQKGVAFDQTPFDRSDSPLLSEVGASGNGGVYRQAGSHEVLAVCHGGQVVAESDRSRPVEFFAETHTNKSPIKIESGQGSKCVSNFSGESKRILKDDCVKAFNSAKFESQTRRHGTGLRAMLDSSWFEFVVVAIILVNIVITGLEIQYLGNATGYNLSYRFYNTDVAANWPYGEAFEIVDWCVLAFFTVELALRLIVHKLAYFRKCMHWLDVVIVATGFMDAAMTLHSSLDFQHLRMLRLMKLTRMVRGIRFLRMPKVFDCLRILVEAIKASVDALMWSVAVLFVIQCLVAMTMSQLVHSYLNDESVDIERRHDVFSYYGTFTRSLITMFEILFANWSPACRVLIDNMGQLYGVPILLYRCVAGFAVLNVVNAVFIQQTIKVAQSDTEIMIMEKKRAKEAYEKKLRTFFAKLDASGDGILSFEEFESIVDEPMLRAWLDALGIDPDHLREFFDLLDNGDGEVTVDEFIQGASKVRGQAQSLDLAYLVHHQRLLAKKVSDIGDVLRISRGVQPLHLEPGGNHAS